MPSHSSVAASVRAQKEKHPANYCRSPRCLWRIVDKDGNPTPCRNHPVAPVAPAACPCPGFLLREGRHVPTCPKYENPADVPEIADDDPRLVDEFGEVGFTSEPIDGVQSPFYVSAVYYANSYDAEIVRRREAVKREQMRIRLATVIARMAGAEAAD